MSQPAQWEFGGNIPENYARYMEPAIFASWGADLVEVDDHARAALLDEVSTALQPYISAEGLAFPLEAHLVRARK